jgi:hypothetical protein
MTNCDTAGRSILMILISSLTALVISLPCWAGKNNKVLGEVSFVSKVSPGHKSYVFVALKENPRAQFSDITAEIKLDVSPDRAAVLVDGAFAGIAHDFGGWGRAMLVSPGKHHVTVALVGYRPYETDVNLQPEQKITLKADLALASVLQAAPAVKKN